jgi:hypothetical protein
MDSESPRTCGKLWTPVAIPSLPREAAPRLVNSANIRTLEHPSPADDTFDGCGACGRRPDGPSLPLRRGGVLLRSQSGAESGGQFLNRDLSFESRNGP